MKRIAIVSAHFMPNVGYNEVYLARTFAKLGYHVRVITSTKPSPSAKSIINSDYNTYKAIDADYRYEIIRFKPLFYYKSNVVAKGLKDAILKFMPDYVLVIGLGKIFPYPVLKKTRQFRLFVFLGNNMDMLTWRSKSIAGKFKTFFIQKLLKSWIYERAIRNSDKIVLYTNSTEEIIKKIISARYYNVFENKILKSTLGFDESIFQYSSEIRNTKRDELKIAPNEIVAITCTRIKQEKNIDRLILLFDNLHRSGIQVKYIIIGFLDDSYSLFILDLVKKCRYPDLFICLPFQSHKVINELYNAADFSIFTQAAISILESMGTGLFCFLPENKSVEHLLKKNTMGYYYANENDLEANLRLQFQNINNLTFNIRQDLRQEVYIHNKLHFSYASIVKKLIDDINTKMEYV
jgi:glycosyltransferase involved in cell wall biosynthesis